MRRGLKSLIASKPGWKGDPDFPDSMAMCVNAFHVHACSCHPGHRSLLSPECFEALAAGAICFALPDLDTIGFSFGIYYGDVWGHRGCTHCFVSAALLATAVTFSSTRRRCACKVVPPLGLSLRGDREW